MENLTDDSDDDDESSDGSSEGLDSESAFDHYGGIPTVMPRARFSGHCNVATVKDGVCLGFNHIIFMRN